MLTSIPIVLGSSSMLHVYRQIQAIKGCSGPQIFSKWHMSSKGEIPAGLGGKNGWAVPGVCIEPVHEKLAWIPHVLELKKSFVKKLDVLKKSKFLPRSVRHFSLSDLWSYTVGFLLQLWLISVSGTASLQGCETYNFDLPKDTASFCKSYTKDNKNFLHNF